MTVHHEAAGWLGRLSMALTVAAPQLPKPERKHAARTLDEFRSVGGVRAGAARAARGAETMIARHVHAHHRARRRTRRGRWPSARRRSTVTAALREAEENITDLLPDGYRAVITHWTGSEER